jgi:hypothetical protein
VTDNQKPAWLNLDNPKVTVVDNTEILPPEALPTFNTEVLEAAIHKVPNISEFFLYGNDDMFFGAKVTPDFFFTPEGFPIIRGIRESTLENSWAHDTYIRNVFRACFRVAKEVADSVLFIPHHNIDAYRKSFYEEAELLFAKECEELLKKRFRGECTTLRRLVQCLDYAKKRSVFKQVQMDFLQESCLKELGNLTPLLVKPVDSFYSNLHKLKRHHKKLLRAGKHKLFCLNVTPESLDSDRVALKVFLEALFPEPSLFEKT